MKQRAILFKLHNLSSFENEKQKTNTTFDGMFSQLPPAESDQCKETAPTTTDLFTTASTPFSVPIEWDDSGFQDDIDCDWEMDDDDTDSNDVRPLHTVSPSSADQGSSLYSFYFEDADMQNDDSSVSLHDDIELDDVDYCLDGIRENPDSFWASGPILTQERRSSAAEVSLSSSSHSFESLSDFNP